MITETSAPTPLSDAPLATDEAAQDTAERRQVTVMFSDLVGSTALSARMDPEDLREVISAYQKCVAETVQRFGGFVAKYMGDGVLVYFGYPQAREDDAERSVWAGLDLIQAVGRLNSSTPLHTRVGIATGRRTLWKHLAPPDPVGITFLFVVVQNVEAIFVAPRIVGNSVGLHPMTVIVSIFVWGLLIGGLLGPLLAVPLTAATKVLLARYVWGRRLREKVAEVVEEVPVAQAAENVERV